ncbi:MAG: peptidyl-prolyl cis-trans isomerase [Nitrospinaceae bacterium]|nr:MAG: peptidyl-prolyl cis-trans isomerase [Nitrospinaceae bacterium]
MQIHAKCLSLIQISVFLLAGFWGSSQALADGNSAVKKGDKVTLEYKGTLDDGTVFDSSEKHKTPLEFEVGSGKVIPGFDQAVMGMKKGEEKKFTLQPSEAYGDRNPQLTQIVPREQLPKGHEPKAGMMLAVGTPDGRQIPATITEVTADNVTLDMNHPLAGKALTFNIKLVKISQ